jgi:hypothetical protein
VSCLPNLQDIRSNPAAINDPKNEAYNMRRQGMHTAVDGSLVRSNNAAAAALRSMLVEVYFFSWFYIS